MQKEDFLTISHQFCNIVVIKRLNGVKDMYEDVSWGLSLSLNVAASQTLRYKISLFVCPLFTLHRSICGIKKYMYHLHLQLLWYRLKFFFLHLHLKWDVVHYQIENANRFADQPSNIVFVDMPAFCVVGFFFFLVYCFVRAEWLYRTNTILICIAQLRVISF